MKVSREMFDAQPGDRSEQVIQASAVFSLQNLLCSPPLTEMAREEVRVAWKEAGEERAKWLKGEGVNQSAGA